MIAVNAAAPGQIYIIFHVTNLWISARKCDLR